jgi:hypothetical protein
MHVIEKSQRRGTPEDVFNSLRKWIFLSKSDGGNNGILLHKSENEHVRILCLDNPVRLAVAASQKRIVPGHCNCSLYEQVNTAVIACADSGEISLDVVNKFVIVYAV